MVGVVVTTFPLVSDAGGPTTTGGSVSQLPSVAESPGGRRERRKLELELG